MLDILLQNLEGAKKSALAPLNAFCDILEGDPDVAAEVIARELGIIKALSKAVDAVIEGLKKAEQDGTASDPDAVVLVDIRDEFTTACSQVLLDLTNVRSSSKLSAKRSHVEAYQQHEKALSEVRHLPFIVIQTLGWINPRARIADGARIDGGSDVADEDEDEEHSFTVHENDGSSEGNNDSSEQSSRDESDADIQPSFPADRAVRMMRSALPHLKYVFGVLSHLDDRLTFSSKNELVAGMGELVDILSETVGDGSTRNEEQVLNETIVFVKAELETLYDLIPQTFPDLRQKQVEGIAALTSDASAYDGGSMDDYCVADECEEAVIDQNDATGSTSNWTTGTAGRDATAESTPFQDQALQALNDIVRKRTAVRLRVDENLRCLSQFRYQFDNICSEEHKKAAEAYLAEVAANGDVTNWLHELEVAIAALDILDNNLRSLVLPNNRVLSPRGDSVTDIDQSHNEELNESRVVSPSISLSSFVEGGRMRASGLLRAVGLSRNGGSGNEDVTSTGTATKSSIDSPSSIVARSMGVGTFSVKKAAADLVGLKSPPSAISTSTNRSNLRSGNYSDFPEITTTPGSDGSTSTICTGALSPLPSNSSVRHIDVPASGGDVPCLTSSSDRSTRFSSFDGSTKRTNASSDLDGSFDGSALDTGRFVSSDAERGGNDSFVPPDHSSGSSSEPASEDLLVTPRGSGNAGRASLSGVLSSVAGLFRSSISSNSNAGGRHRVAAAAGGTMLDGEFACEESPDKLIVSVKELPKKEDIELDPDWKNVLDSKPENCSMAAWCRELQLFEASNRELKCICATPLIIIEVFEDEQKFIEDQEYRSKVALREIEVHPDSDDDLKERAKLTQKLVRDIFLDRKNWRKKPDFSCGDLNYVALISSSDEKMDQSTIGRHRKKCEAAAAAAVAAASVGDG